jgi:hypothetical protein
VQERDQDLGSIAAMLAVPGGRDRDVAEWTIAADVCRRALDYGRGVFVPKHPDGWSVDDHQQIQSLLARWRSQGLEELREAARAIPCAFGRWRVMVSDFESAEASKLRTVRWAFIVLERLRGLPGAQAKQIDPLMLGLADLLRIEWGVRLDSVPLDERDAIGANRWADRVARRLDLLPNAWRHA